MKRSFKLAVVLLLGIFSITRAEVTSFKAGFPLKVGVNVSHWLSQSDKRGEERKNDITQADFDTIAYMGFDFVRIPVDEEQLWDSLGTKDTEAFQLLHNAVQWAIHAQLRVVVDLHILRSHHFIAESNLLWSDPAEQEKLVHLWQELSGELKQYPTEMVAYEILNEAVAENHEDWNKLLNKVVAAIRAVEPERKIVIGSNRWQIPDTFPYLRVPANDPNIILSFHFYTPLLVTHYRAPWVGFAEYEGPVNYPGQSVSPEHLVGLPPKTLSAVKQFNGFFTKDTLEKMIEPAIRVAKQMNLPLFCGEFGVYPKYIPKEIRLQWYKDMCEIFNKNNIAYCHWCYKGDFPIVDENRHPDWELVSILTGKKSK